MNLCGSNTPGMFDVVPTRGATIVPREWGGFTSDSAEVAVVESFAPGSMRGDKLLSDGKSIHSGYDFG